MFLPIGNMSQVEDMVDSLLFTNVGNKKEDKSSKWSNGPVPKASLSVSRVQ